MHANLVPSIDFIFSFLIFAADFIISISFYAFAYSSIIVLLLVLPDMASLILTSSEFEIIAASLEGPAALSVALVRISRSYSLNCNFLKADEFEPFDLIEAISEKINC